MIGSRYWPLNSTLGAMFLALGVAASAAADESAGLELHGFATQGYVHTSANRFFGPSERGSTAFTELGVNGAFDLTDDVHLAGQVLARRAGTMYSGTPELDFALVDVTVSASATGAMGVRAGRLKNPLGLYNETRDVAFTRPGIFLPQVIYFDKVRNLLLSADGAQLYAQTFRDWGNLDLALSAGVTRVDANVEYAYLGWDFAGDLDSAGVDWLAKAMYETADGRWRGGLSAAMSTMRFSAAPSDPIGSGTTRFLYWIASIQYTGEVWSLTAEYMREPVDWDGYGPVLDNADSTAEAYYAQLAWRARPDLELNLRYEEGYADRDDRDGTRRATLTGGLIPASNGYSKNWVAGVRWDLTPDLMLRVEQQWNHGTFILSNRENPNPAALREDWQLFSLLLSYRF